MRNKRVLLIVTGGIAAYKALELVRRLRDRGATVRCIMTEGAQRFVTPLSFAAISGTRVHTELFEHDGEHEVGHIGLARGADVIVVAPATADFIARLAHGQANDLASAVILAANVPVLLAPAMNPSMWGHPAVRRNVETLVADGLRLVGPARGEMAESGEAGEGRMAEPAEILTAIASIIAPRPEPLKGRRIVVTSGPTHEPIDPVRYIANRSSGRQGHAIAAALAARGADVHLVSGPVIIPDPQGVTTYRVETAREMEEKVSTLLPADAGVFVAAVADWRVAKPAASKLKKAAGEAAPALALEENPDILKGVGHHALRPRLVVGFAAETNDVLRHAAEKLKRKGADIIVANDVSDNGPGVMGGDRNKVWIVTADGAEEWHEADKGEVAERLADLIVRHLVA